jgi:hypothetical protein
MFPSPATVTAHLDVSTMENLHLEGSSNATIDTAKVWQRIAGWLSHRLSAEAGDWLMQQVTAVANDGSDRAFYTAFSLIPKKLGKADLYLATAELRSAEAICHGWQPEYWRIDQAARALLLLSLPQANETQVKQRIEQLYTTAELEELIAILQTLPLMPNPDRYRYWADEGVRSHITGVFEAIALRNPYPAKYFETAAWNQLILKTIFIESPLYPIISLRHRRNQPLARMLRDYIHERWAAKRRVTPELWQLFSPFLDADILADCAKGLAMPDPMQQLAIARCLIDANLIDTNSLDLRALLNHYPDLTHKAQNINWHFVYHYRQATTIAEIPAGFAPMPNSA